MTVKIGVLEAGGKIIDVVLEPPTLAEAVRQATSQGYSRETSTLN